MPQRQDHYSKHLRCSTRRKLHRRKRKLQTMCYGYLLLHGKRQKLWLLSWLPITLPCYTNILKLRPSRVSHMQWINRRNSILHWACTSWTHLGKYLWILSYSVPWRKVEVIYWHSLLAKPWFRLQVGTIIIYGVPIWYCSYIKLVSAIQWLWCKLHYEVRSNLFFLWPLRRKLERLPCRALLGLLQDLPRALFEFHSSS